jgi:hypothetical protein
MRNPPPPTLTTNKRRRAGPLKREEERRERNGAREAGAPLGDGHFVAAVNARHDEGGDRIEGARVELRGGGERLINR